MTHDEYLAGLETATDGEAEAVLAHAAACASCRRDARLADRALARLDGHRGGSRLEDVASVVAVAAMLAIAIVGLSSSRPAPSPARYRIVGGPDGVVAYTPTETIVTVGGASKEVPR